MEGGKDSFGKLVGAFPPLLVSHYELMDSARDMEFLSATGSVDIYI